MTMPDGAPNLTFINQELVKLATAQKNHVAATLAAAVVTASNRPHSINEVLQVQRDFYFSLFPEPSYGSFQAWKEAFDGDKPHT
jgi:hypothetical protein